jgi:hypothetical protein
VAVSVSSLSEFAVAVFAWEGQFILMDADVVTEIAEFGEFHGAELTLENLVHSFSVRVHLMNQNVVSFIFALFL